MVRKVIVIREDAHVFTLQQHGQREGKDVAFLILLSCALLSDVLDYCLI